MTKSAVRFNTIRTISALAAGTRHARRLDVTSQARIRAGAVSGAGLSWTAYGAEDRDLVTAWKAHKDARGAKERANAPLALQAIVVVSPEWIDGGGGRHDPKNQRNLALFDQARAWAESWAGKGSVIAARLDLDESGAGVVDLTIVPLQTQKNRVGKETLRISTNAGMKALCAETGEQKSFAAAQTSWAAWAQRTMDPAIERGTSKELTGAEHLRPEQYGRVADQLREMEGKVAELQAQEASLSFRLREAEEARMKAEREASFLMERAQTAAAAKIAEADAYARDVTSKAIANANQLKAKGQNWANGYREKVRNEAFAEAETIKETVREQAKHEGRKRIAILLKKARAEGEKRIEAALAPTRTWAGRLGMVKVRSEAERQAEVEAAKQAVRDDEASVREVFQEDASRSKAEAEEARKKVRNLSSQLEEVRTQRDMLQGRVAALTAPGLHQVRDRSPSLGR